MKKFVAAIKACHRSCGNVILVVLLVRLPCIIFFVLAVVLTAVGPGLTCHIHRSLHKCDGGELGATKWSNSNQAFNSGGKLQGQYFCLTMQIILLCSVVTFTAYQVYRRSLQLNKPIVGKIAGFVAFLLTLICGCLESWYASGYDTSEIVDEDQKKPDDEARGTTFRFEVNGWAWASVSLFVACACMAVDIIIAFRQTHLPSPAVDDPYPKVTFVHPHFPFAATSDASKKQKPSYFVYVQNGTSTAPRPQPLPLSLSLKELSRQSSVELVHSATQPAIGVSRKSSQHSSRGGSASSSQRSSVVNSISFQV